MQYHALSLASAGGDVDLIGLEGAGVMPAVATNARIHVHRMGDRSFKTRAKGGVRRFVFASAMRSLSQGVRLFAILMRIPTPNAIVVQNPPAVPTLAVSWLVSRLRGARMVIDWHNLSHTIAAVRLGDQHRVVKSIARSERRWARRADAHLTVSKALAEWLKRKYGVNATVVYDRPGAAFTRATADQASALWQRIAKEQNLPSARTPLIVCPTSWTPDEDFDLLLEALERAERQLKSDTPLLTVLLTGRGPLRETFEARAARRSFKAIIVKTLWLEPDDYPVLVGMADLGLCLHQSSSGLDLPMKLADLRGAAVPTAVYDYAPVLSEVMTPAQEGVTFRDPGGLASVLVSVARGAIAADSPLARSRAWLAQHPTERWDAQWDANAKGVLLAQRG
jgi:beta-1,4-mannosyltransferase